jgi:hypothetical protein
MANIVPNPNTTNTADPTRGILIPGKIINANPHIMSMTSYAPDCFINQDFSQNLQAYLVGYVNSIYSEYSPYG